MKTPASDKTPAPPEPASSPVKRRILLVDDHPVTREGVSAVLSQAGDLELTGEADSAPAAIAFLQKQPVDLAIVDISLKTTNGIELLKHIRALAPALPVLIMSMHDENVYAERAMRAGARGYIMKQEVAAKIVTAVRTMLGGELYLSDRMKERMLHRLVHQGREPAGTGMDTLSDREMEVFQLIGNGYSTRQIAAKLTLSVKTIDSYREHLKLKLQMEAGNDLVRYAIQWMKSEQVF